MGKIRDVKAIEPLFYVLRFDSDTSVRGASAISLGRFLEVGGVRQALSAVLQGETTEYVKNKIQRALDDSDD